jgi:signal transduction histidine kinase
MRIKATLRTVELELDIQEPLPLIGANEEHAAQLLSNLIDNAIKYTDPGGRVFVQLREDGTRVVGKVEDSGIGIAPEDQSRIFSGFYRAKNAKEVEPYGTGLGLPLVMRIIEMYDGDLELQSELGKGSTFTFSFPCLEGEGNCEALLAAEGQS